MKERPHCGNKAMRRSLSMHYKEVNSFRCRTTLLPTEFIFRNFEPSLSHDPFPSSTDTMSLNRQRSNCLDTQSHEDRKPVICSGQCKIFDRAVLVYIYIRIYIYIWWRPATPPAIPMQHNKATLFTWYLYAGFTTYIPPTPPTGVPGRGVSYTLHTLSCIHNLLLPIQYHYI